MSNLDSKRLKEILDYNPETGIFTWRKNRKSTKIGIVAGSKRADGYIRIMVDKKSFLAHRLAWLHTHGEWPKNIIDHKNSIRHDNRLSNLRDVTQFINLQNKKTPYSHNKSGHLGVSWNKTMNKWQAQICANRTLHHLGYFDSKEKASEEYIAKKNVLHFIALQEN